MSGKLHKYSNVENIMMISFQHMSLGSMTRPNIFVSGTFSNIFHTHTAVTIHKTCTVHGQCIYQNSARIKTGNLVW